MSSRQLLHAANSRDDAELKVQRSHGFQRLDHSDGAVVQRWITPDQEPGILPWTQFCKHHVVISVSSGLVPVANRVVVPQRRCNVLRSVTFRVLNLDNAIGPVRDVATTYLGAQRHQVVLGSTLVRHEEHIDLVEGLDRLHGDLLWVACTHSDDVDLSHLAPFLRWEPTATKTIRSTRTQHAAGAPSDE